MPSSTSPTILGLDVHKNTISAGILRPGHDVADVEKISSDDDAVRRLIARFGNPRRLRACYEAGPTGYELCRLLRSLGVACEVIAPSLIPTAPGDRVKTDKRDCRRLARLFRAGELVAIRVPTVAEEAVRDLCRARADMVIDQTRARHRLGKFLLRHNRIWRGGDNWTVKHQRLDRRPTLRRSGPGGHLRPLPGHPVGPRSRGGRHRRRPGQWYRRAPFSDTVARLAAYRGITHLGALTLAAEVCDWRRFGSAGHVHGLHRAHPQRALLRPERPARPHHPRRQRPPAHPAGRVGLGVSVPPGRRRRTTPPPRRPRAPTSWPERGPPRFASAAGSVASTNAKPTATSSSPPSPENSPGSCGPK